MYGIQSILVLISNSVSIISVSLIILLLIFRNTKLLSIVISILIISLIIVIFKIITVNLNYEMFLRPDNYYNTCKKLFKIDNIFSDNSLVSMIKNINSNKYKMRGLPSIHTTISTSIVTLLYLYYPTYRKIILPLGIIYVGLVGYSRIYLNCHRPVQVIVGYILGIILPLILYKIIGKLTKNLLK